MTWHRGFILCAESDSVAVGALLGDVATSVLLDSCNGETAFAFSSRIVPDLGSIPGYVVGVDDGVANYFHEIHGDFSPAQIDVRLGLTFSLVVGADSAVMKSKNVRKDFARLGRACDFAKEEGRRGYRWDFDGKPGDPGIGSFSDSLASIEAALIQADESYRVATFDDRFGAVRGELDEIEEIWAEPIAIVTVTWTGKSGDLQSATANDSEFSAEADDLPDLPM